jgi:isopenicillin-N epimerase
VLPIQRIVRELAARGVETLVDGSHAPGMVPLDLAALRAAYYTGNCHKWICAPKGAAFLVVRRDLQETIRPLTISHGANSPRRDRSRFLIEFAWMGTSDPTGWMTVPEAIRFVGRLTPGGWPEIRQRNRALAIAGRRILCDALGTAVPCPDDFLGSMASVVLPPSIQTSPPTGPLYLDPLQDELIGTHCIEVPVIPWACESGRLLRVSAQLYNYLPQYERLGSVLQGFLRK